MGQKRPREAPSTITRRAEIYEDLANIDQNIRLTAAHALLTDLVPQADVDQLQEILRRLIRGLCSGRKAARLGFSVALAEFLNTIYGPDSRHPIRNDDLRGVIDVLINQTRVPGGSAGQEGRDHHIGRLFGAEAIIKSGILFHSTDNGGLCRKTLDVVFDLAKEKPWLREQCGFVLYQSFESHTTLHYVQQVIDGLQSAGLARTPEGVAIWITVQKKFPSVTVPTDVWHSNTPLHRKEKSQLAMILKEASLSELEDTSSNAKATQRGSWSANIHFAWLVVITELLSQAESTNTSKISRHIPFSDFWRTCVEDGLFKGTSSDERKYWGLTLFQRGLSIASTPEVIAVLFSKKLVQCLSNHLASSERYLHRAAERARKALIDKARHYPSIGLIILESLFRSDFINFDKVSKTHTIEEIIVGLSASSSTPEICVLYRAMILQPGVDEEKSAAQRRQLAADQLVAALKGIKSGSGNVPTDEDSQKRIQQILALLAQFAYFHTGSNAKPAFSSTSHDLFKARLSSSLSHLAAHAEDPSIFIYSLVPIITRGNDVSKVAQLLLDVDDAVQGVLDRAAEIMQIISVRLDTTNVAIQNFYKSALLLMISTFLQVYNNDLDAIGMLEELNESFSQERLEQYRMKKGLTSSSALIEILLGLVAKPSKLFRKVVQQVFESISMEIEKDGLESMLNVLRTKEGRDGQDALFDQVRGDEENGQDADDTTEGSDGHHDASDVEMSNTGVIRHKGPGLDVVDDSPSTSTEDEEDEDGPDEELAAFNAKLAQALGTHTGKEDLDAENSDASDQDMNDEEMEALDEHLEKVFREQKKVAAGKTETKDAKKTIIDFKCRVLELLEIYIKKQHDNPLAMNLILPLLTLLRQTSNPQVSQKAGDSLREYARLCKGNSIPGLEDGQTAIDMLQAVHTEAVIQGSNAHASGCSQASLLLARILTGHDKDHLGQIADIYGLTFSASQKRAVAERNFKVKMSFFTDFNSWISSLRR